MATIYTNTDIESKDKVYYKSWCIHHYDEQPLKGKKLKIQKYQFNLIALIFVIMMNSYIDEKRIREYSNENEDV